MPYTVGLLLVSFVLGAAAQTPVTLSLYGCPMQIFLYDYDHDHQISRAEYNASRCVGCVNSSWCAYGLAGLEGTGVPEGKPINCFGDYCERAHGVDFDFDSLCAPRPRAVAPWATLHVHAMSVSMSMSMSMCMCTCTHPLPTRPPSPSPALSTRARSDQPWSKSHMLAERAGSGTARDGYLQPDELWTPRCNLLRDMLTLSDMDPHVMLVVFLPTLLFESATFGVDMGILRKQIVQILLMAFPAMIVASAITGGLVYAIYEEHGWTFWQSWLIGIINSATDPVAVVALLKELGAAPTLGTLIEGESLVNDGSAVVLYVWVKNVVGYAYSDEAPSWMRSAEEGEIGEIGVELLRVVAQMLVLGVLLGVAAGKLACFAVRLCYDRLIEVSVLIGVSYLVFWLGELIMGTSAVLAVVVMGFYVNVNKSAISGEALHFMHELYETMAHFLNTIIFVIAGSKLGTSVVVSFQMSTGASSAVGFKWLIIYPIVLVARGVTILLFYPLLKRLGTGCTWKDAVVMWWGGLRGSVGLALALSIAHTTYSHKMWGGVESQGYNRNLPCRDVPNEALHMTLVVVFCTVVFNGMTMAPLMKYLKLTEVPDERKWVLNMVHAQLEEKTREILDGLRALPVMERLTTGSEESDVNWDEVDRLIYHAPTPWAVKDADRAAWLQVLGMERATYLSKFEKGEVTHYRTFHHLESFMAKLLADAGSVPVDQIGALYDAQFDEFVRVIKKALEPGSSTHSKEVAFEVALSYLIAQDEVHHLIHGAEEYSSVEREHEDNIDAMLKLVEQLKVEAPQEMARFSTRLAAKMTLLGQRDVLKHWMHEGVVTHLDGHALVEVVNKRLMLMESDLLRRAEVQAEAWRGSMFPDLGLDGLRALRGGDPPPAFDAESGRSGYHTDRPAPTTSMYARGRRGSVTERHRDICANLVETSGVQPPPWAAAASSSSSNPAFASAAATAASSAAAGGAPPVALNKRGFAVSSAAASCGAEAGAGTGAAGPSKPSEKAGLPPAHARGPASASADQWTSARKKVACVNQVSQLPNAEKLRHSLTEDSASKQLTPEELKLKRRLSLTDGDDRYSNAKGKKDKPERLRRGTVKDGSPAAKATAPTVPAAAAACRGGGAEAPVATSSTTDPVQFL